MSPIAVENALDSMDAPCRLAFPARNMNFLVLARSAAAVLPEIRTRLMRVVIDPLLPGEATHVRAGRVVNGMFTDSRINVSWTR